MRKRILALAAAALFTTVLAGCSGAPASSPTPSASSSSAAGKDDAAIDGTASDADAADGDATDGAAGETKAPAIDPKAPPAFAGTCAYTKGGSAARPVDAPPAKPTVAGSVTATLTTSAGKLTMTLDGKRTPCTVGSFVSLASQKYFDGTPCHRLTTTGIYVLQCGDPTGSGTGGPGYSFADELGGGEVYPAGTVAMANAGPNTNGSQFFLVYEDSPSLPADYTVFGALDEASLKTLKTIAAKGTDTGAVDGAPKDGVTITSAVAK